MSVLHFEPTHQRGPTATTAAVVATTPTATGFARAGTIRTERRDAAGCLPASVLVLSWARFSEQIFRVERPASWATIEPMPDKGTIQPNCARQTAAGAAGCAAYVPDTADFPCSQVF